jgi:GTP pyrophosphokinase
MVLSSDYIAKFNNLFSCGKRPLTKEETELIRKAFEISKRYHEKTGTEKRLYHYIDISQLLLDEIGLGSTAVISSLLYGIPLDIYSLKDIEKDFGHDVRDILDGLHNISKLQTERISYQSDTFRNMFISIVEDIRVLLIKLAHRVYDLRYLSKYSTEHQQRVINEVKYIYIPISHRLGLYNIKTEMEEQVMKYEMPEIYEDIKRKIKESKTKRETYIKDFIAPVTRELIKQGFDYEIKYRTKSIPSIYAKMKRQNVDFDHVFDLFAIRIILNVEKSKEKEACWRVYSIVTDIYPPNIKRLRDWISQPKVSGYESLHTTVKGSDGHWVEVQIRTVRMDEEAEKGQAAHWLYKGMMKSKSGDNWLEQVRDALENPTTKSKNIYKTHKNRSEKVFVFTPKGDLKQLPAGATVLDFAYDVHTKVGATCKGARVNNKVVPIRYVLQNGDKVDVITAKNQKPKLDWLAFVVTDRARSKIKRQLKEEKYKEAEAGKEILYRKFKNWKINNISDELINFLVKHLKLDTAIDLYYLVATEKLEIPLVKQLIFERYLNENNEEKIPLIDEEKKETVDNKQEEEKEVLYISENLKNVNYYFSKCCNPIVGDDVFGFVTTQGRISIHRYDCPNAKRLLERYPYRVIPVKWITTGNEVFKNAVIKLKGNNEIGLLNEITKTIAEDFNINMRSVHIDTKGKKFEGTITLLVKSNEHLKWTIHRLSQVKGIERVTRIK